jgi:hypothetical protein
VVAKVRERLAVSKRTTHRVHMDRINLKELNKVEGKVSSPFEIEVQVAIAKMKRYKSPGSDHIPAELI